MGAKIIIEKDLEIPMRDGCGLRGDLFRPDSPEKLPVLLTRTPYDKKFPQISYNMLDAIRAAQRGYNVMIVDCRGRFASFWMIDAISCAVSSILSSSLTTT